MGIDNAVVIVKKSLPWDGTAGERRSIAQPFDLAHP